MAALQLRPFDLICVQGVGRISRAIRWATGTNGIPAPVSHVGFITHAGDLYTATAQEALIERRSIVRRPLGEYAGTGESVAIFRPLRLREPDFAAMMARADETVGRAYSYRNIGLQLIDALLGKALGRPVYAARRFSSDETEECSHDVSAVFQADGLDFGEDRGYATPASIYRFCVTRPDRYQQIRPLIPMPARVLPFGYYLPIEPEEVA